MGFVLLLGGARSGKSALAYRLASEAGDKVTVIATATAGDAEMAARIERHRGSRPARWDTVEEPMDLADAVASCDRHRFLVLDCLTLWVSNLLVDGCPADDVIDRAASLAKELAGRNAVVVSNEVGLGIVPANDLARTYRDTLGTVNAEFAARAERAVLMVAGRALDLLTPR